MIKLDVAARHALDREPLFEATSNSAPTEGCGTRNCGNRGVDAVDNKARQSLVDDFRNGASPERDDRGSIGHRLDHDQPKRFRPVDREKQRQRQTEKFFFVAVADLTDELHPRPLEQSLDLVIVVIEIGLVDLGRDF